MAEIAEIKLDIKKTGYYSNDVINLRVGDNTDQIIAHIMLNGEPHQNIESATFFAEKPDETIIANDPANVVDPSTISYPIPEQLTAAAGNITKAYFIINTTSSTDSFRINILPSVNPKGDSLDYIPGLKILQDKLNVKINAMKEQINNIDTSDEVKKVMNDALDKAKTDYMATFSQAIAELNATVSALKSKEATATESGNNLDAAIDSMNKKIADVNSFLDDVQKQIIAANASFTADQQAKVAQSISDLKAKIDALTVAKTGPKGDIGPQGPKGDKGDKGDTGSVDNAGLTAAPAFVELQTQVTNSAVGTNLLKNTSDFSSNWSGMTSISTTSEYDGHPSMMFISNGKLLALQLLDLGKLGNSTQYIASFWAKADNAGDKAHTELGGGIDNADFVLTTNWVRYTAVLTSLPDANTNASHSSCFFGAAIKNKGNIYIALPKLEKGSLATDWCPNPTEVLTQSDYAKIKAAIDGKLESYAKSDDVDTKINSIPKGISLWKGSADDYAAIESKDDSTEYNVVDDTGIKNIYVGSSEIYKRGIPEGTVLWNSDLIFDPKTNSFNKSVQYNSVKYSVLGADFDYSLVKNGFMIGINDCIPTDNTQYPFLGYSNSNLPRDSHKREKDADGNFTNSINYIFVPINKLKPVGFDIKSLYVLWTKDTTTSETVDNPWCYKKDMIGSLRRAAWTTNITNTSLYLNINDQNNFSLAFRGASQFTPRDTSLKISIIYPLIQQVIAM